MAGPLRVHPEPPEGSRPRTEGAMLRLCLRRAPRPGFRSGELVSLRLPSDVGCIEEAVDLLVRHCLATTSWTSRRLRFALRVVLAESLANAIICGNGEDPAKMVKVEAELEADSIRLQVTDEGPGFNPLALPDPTTPHDIENTCGRGVFLIRRLVDEVSFNTKGNSICMTLRRK